MAEGLLCHPFQVAGPKLCQTDSIRSQDGFAYIYIQWQEEGMELGKLYCLTSSILLCANIWNMGTKALTQG